jgi:hypothetical protein
MTERRGFFTRMFGEEGGDDDTRVFSPQEVGAAGEEPREVEQHPHGFTVERAAEIIKDLPPDVSRESAVRIVRGTLVAAGIRFEDLERSTRARETRLRSEIELARGRQEELKQRTEEVLRSLEEDMRKAREARDNGVTEEEERISRANSGLEDLRQVRGFFDFPEEYAESHAVAEPGEQTADHEGPPAAGAEDYQSRGAPWTRPADREEQTADHREAPFGPEAGDETRVMEPYDAADETRVIRRSGPLAPPEDAGER